MPRCSICHTLIQPADETTTCPTCRQAYHTSCWSELGGCATYGCAKAVPAKKPPPPTLMGTGWGDTKSCPACGRQLASSLLLCSCGARFPYADPMERAEYHRWRAREAEVSSSRRIILALFLVSLLGLPAPLTGTIAGVIAHQRRELLAGANGTYLAMGYGAAALGATYAMVILLLMFGAVFGA